MQTFLPYPDIERSVGCLDVKRLGKQRVECAQILKTLYGQSTGWINHPAVRMWRGYEPALHLYMSAAIAEWIDRGYKNTMDYDKEYHVKMLNKFVRYPPWWGSFKLHTSHQSNLLRKDPEWYGGFGWNVPNDMPYFWPVD